MSDPTHIPRPTSPRRGLSHGTFIFTVATLTTLALTTAVLTPRLLRGDEGVSSERRAAVPEHQRLLDGLAELVGRSGEVLAVHPRRDGRRFTEILIWISDDENIGAPDLPELALVSHSEVLQTITFFTWPKDEEVPFRFQDLSEELLREPLFSQSLRTNPVIRSRLIGRGISDMRCEWETRSDDQSPRLRISLIWPSYSADPPDEASTAVDAVVRPNVVRDVLNHE